MTSEFNSRCPIFVAASLYCFVYAGLIAGITNADDPFRALADDKPAPGEKKKSELSEANASELRIAVGQDESVTFGPSGCPTIVCGSNAYDASNGTVTAQLDGEYDRNALTVLSDNGKLFAAALKSKNQEETPIRVWSTETGEVVYDVPGNPKRFSDLILISRDRYVIVGGRSTSDLQVWDIEDKKQLRSIDVKGTRIENGKAAFSPEGDLLLAVSNNKLTLFKTSTGKPVTTMSPPGALVVPDLSQPATTKSSKQKASPLPPRGDGNEAVFVYAWMQALKFSPDGTEIAAVSTHPSPRLIVWDIKGKLLMDVPLILPQMAFWEHSLQWLPNKSGWLVSGHVFDRASLRTVVGVRKQFGEDLKLWLQDNDHLVGVFPQHSSELQAHTIPWAEIRESLASMKDPASGLLGPAQSVSVKVNFGGQANGDRQVGEQIAKALVSRLQRDGIKVTDGQKAVFQLKLSEQQGDQLPIYERQSQFDFRGQNTGRTVAERKGNLVIELLVDGIAEPIWRDTVSANSARSFQEEINDVSVRKSMLEDLAKTINELPMPYFIPKNDKGLGLPMVF